MLAVRDWSDDLCLVEETKGPDLRPIFFFLIVVYLLHTVWKAQLKTILVCIWELKSRLPCNHKP